MDDSKRFCKAIESLSMRVIEAFGYQGILVLTCLVRRLKMKANLSSIFKTVEKTAIKGISGGGGNVPNMRSNV